MKENKFQKDLIKEIKEKQTLLRAKQDEDTRNKILDKLRSNKKLKEIEFYTFKRVFRSS